VGSGISWTIYRLFAPRCRQITTPAPHHSILSFTDSDLAPCSKHFLSTMSERSHTHTHNHLTNLWILSGTSRVSRYQKKHSLTTLIVVINHPYQLSPSTTIHSILPIQSMCFTVFFHNLSPSFLWTTSWPGTLHSSSTVISLLFTTSPVNGDK